MSADTGHETTAPEPCRKRVLVFDGDCRFCVAASLLLVRLGLVGDEDRIAVGELAPDEQVRAFEAGAHDELLVMERGSNEARGGVEGLLWLLEGRKLARIAGLPPVRGALGAAYRFIAYNRRYLSTPAPRSIPCACDPTPRPPLQLLLIGASALIVTGVLLLLGLGAPAELRLVGSRLGLAGPLVKSGWAWAFPLLFAGTLGAGARLPYVTHLAATAGAGAALLAPLAAASVIAPEWVERGFETLLQLSCLAAGALMFAMQRRRVAFQRLPSIWLWGWAVCAGFGLLTLGWLHTLG